MNLINLDRDSYEWRSMTLNQLKTARVEDRIREARTVSIELEQELTTFRERIKNISQTLQEQRQSKTNNLLQLVTLIGGISSISPIFIVIIKIFYKVI
jgi:hypothetical protein